MFCGYYAASLCLRQCLCCLGYCCSVGYYYTFCSHLNGTYLGVASVADNYYVVGLDVFFHDFGISGTNKYSSAGNGIFGVTDNKLAVQCLYKIGIGCLSLGKYTLVIYFHIGVYYVFDGYYAFKLSVVRYGQCHRTGALHLLPCFFK